jgi:SHS2 domain-containing protein
MSKADKFAGRFEFLEHTADVYVRAHGRNMEEAYENAALSMFETMTDTNKIAQSQEETIEVEAEDHYALLYNWLETLLVKFETENMLYSKFQITRWKETSETFKIEAKISTQKNTLRGSPSKR